MPQGALHANLSSRQEVSICGVYWTKFECTSDKIRRILTTNRTLGARSGSKPLRTLRLRGEAIQCASDTLADSRVQKPKNFLAFFSRLLPHPSTAKRKKKWKGNFWFASPFQSPKRASCCYHMWFALFSALTATEAPCYSCSVVTLYSANHTQSPSHSPLAFARAGCFGVVCVRLVASFESVVTQRISIC